MSVKIRNRHRLKQKDKKALQESLMQQFGEALHLDDHLVEQGRLDEYDLIFVDSIPCFFVEKDKAFFTVPGLLQFQPKKRDVVVDMGAVRFVTNGADVMAPGIVKADSMIEKDQQIWICDERHHKPLAVGIALISGEEMVKETSGKAVKMKHYIGDSLWNKLESIT